MKKNNEFKIIKNTTTQSKTIKIETTESFLQRGGIIEVYDKKGKLLHKDHTYSTSSHWPTSLKQVA